jgi:hypothetical protein
MSPTVLLIEHDLVVHLHILLLLFLATFNLHAYVTLAVLLIVAKSIRAKPL